MTLFYQTFPEDIVGATLGGASAAEVEAQAAALPSLRRQFKNHNE